jgi:DNA-binding transcriptional ArsR family regulator
MTAYKVAQVGELSIPKVYSELRRLTEAGVTEASVGPTGVRRFELTDPDLRRLLQRRAPIISWDEWIRQDTRRRQTPGILPTASKVIDLARYRPAPRSLPNWQEFVRPPEKDEDLRRAGAQVSNRHRKG